MSFLYIHSFLVQFDCNNHIFQHFSGGYLDKYTELSLDNNLPRLHLNQSVQKCKSAHLTTCIHLNQSVQKCKSAHLTTCIHLNQSVQKCKSAHLTTCKGYSHLLTCHSMLQVTRNKSSVDHNLFHHCYYDSLL